MNSFFLGKEENLIDFQLKVFPFFIAHFWILTFSNLIWALLNMGKSGKMDRKSLNFSIEIVWVFYYEVLWIFLLLICWFVKDVVEKRLMENSENFKLNLRNIENI